MENLSHSIEPEPYILTTEEEQEAIRHMIETVKKYYAWKLAQVGCKTEHILAKQSEIDWEKEINREEVLQNANSNKSHAIWQQKQRENEKKDQQIKLDALKARCNAKFFYNLMAFTSQEMGKKLIVNDSNRDVIKTICFWMSEDPRLETELGLSLKKGLLLRGIAGVGKTHMVKCVSWNELKPISIFSMIDIAQEVKSNGEFVINSGWIYLDDVGSEQATVNHYGTKINWFKEFIESYYLRSQAFNKLIISTNNSFQQLEEAYGFRVRSRLREMFNVIDVKGEDLRH